MTDRLSTDPTGWATALTPGATLSPDPATGSAAAALAVVLLVLAIASASGAFWSGLLAAVAASSSPGRGRLGSS